MTKARFASVGFLTVLAVALLPSMALAQSSISGVVKDQTGAVMAGATVTASSEVIIEGTKTTTTNGEGRYEIVDLRPGTYVVTATSPGFDTVKQSVEVPANVTVPVDATLKPGAVTDTVTVESRVATVDVENASRTTESDALGYGRSSDRPLHAVDRILRARRASESARHRRFAADGAELHFDSWQQFHAKRHTCSTGCSPTRPTPTARFRTTSTTRPFRKQPISRAESRPRPRAAVCSVNLVPKDGGNKYHSDIFLSGSDGTGIWQADNLNATTLARSLAQQDKIIKIMDFDG